VEVIIFDGETTLDAQIKINQQAQLSWADLCESSEEGSVDDHGDIPDLMRNYQDRSI
jgi:hypothetical protein